MLFCSGGYEMQSLGSIRTFLTKHGKRRLPSKHLRDALPQASYLGFTGTPIELGEKNTQAVFGDYIDVYDISRAVEDGATVRIFYEGRLAKMALTEDERPKIDDQFEELTEGQEELAKEKLKSKWAALEGLVGSEKRIKLIAKDLVEHWEQRLASMDGKAMIVCMGRRICVELYKVIAELRLACLSPIAPTVWRRELVTGVGESLAGNMLAMDLANMTFVRFFDCEFTLH